MSDTTNEIATFETARLQSSDAVDENTSFLEAVGERVRAARARKNISRKTLSEISGISQRYLAQLETGSGNISIILLRRVADALDYKIEWLVGDEDPYSSSILPLIGLYNQATADQRQKVLSMLEQNGPASAQASRIAFIGLRGAGKSTIGQLFSAQKEMPFLELNDTIEEASGMPVDEVMALYGQEGYRRLEKQSVERIAATNDAIVLAVAGGIVSAPETFNYLLRNYHTIWLKADPEDHMGRVRKQGDERPMAGNPEAMAELRNILRDREALYNSADIVINTSQQSVSEVVAQVLSAVDEHRFFSN
ncbi:MAG: helix-turn-helix transcriptional regulator [Sneathiella sp.]